MLFLEAMQLAKEASLLEDIELQSTREKLLLTNSINNGIGGGNFTNSEQCVSSRQSLHAILTAMPGAGGRSPRRNRTRNVTNDKKRGIETLNLS